MATWLTPLKFFYLPYSLTNRKHAHTRTRRNGITDA